MVRLKDPTINIVGYMLSKHTGLAEPLTVDSIARPLTKRMEGLRDFRPAFRVIAAEFREMEQVHWNTAGGYSGGWAALNPRYSRYKARKVGARGILVRSGALRTAALRPDVTMGVKTLNIRVHNKKLGWHQFGTPHMPARPVVPSNWKRIVKPERVIRDYVRQKMGLA